MLPGVPESSAAASAGGFCLSLGGLRLAAGVGDAFPVGASSVGLFFVFCDIVGRSICSTIQLLDVL